ncbi:hypothetical protein MMC20_007321 [Loxospora ochrophaea]|nr:hypothetical protein [Loxospora ochrophaea]
MSLSVHHSSRGRSRSPGRHERSRSRDHRAPSPVQVVKVKKSSKKYYDDDSDSDTKLVRVKSSSKKHVESSSSSEEVVKAKKASKKHRDSSESSESEDLRRTKSKSKKHHESSSESSESESDHRHSRHKHSKPEYEVVKSKHKHSSPPEEYALVKTRSGDHKASHSHDRDHGRHPSPDRHEHTRPDYTRHASYIRPGEHGYVPPSEQPHYAPPGQYKYEYDHPEEHPPETRHMSISSPHPYYQQPLSPSHERYGQPPHGYAPPEERPENHRHHSSSIGSNGQVYAQPEPYRYAQPTQISYISRSEEHKPYTQTAHAQFVEIKPEKHDRHDKHSTGLNSGMHRLSVSTGVAGALGAAGALSLAPGQVHNHHEGGRPPGSPLLEAYHGTYQSISPMPSPMALASKDESDLSDLEPLSQQNSSDDSRHQIVKAQKESGRKRVSFYDPEPDAMALAAALKHSSPDPGPIVKVLPFLSDDHMMALRTEYKKHIKVQGKGINIAKHIKLKVPGVLGKVAYATALGRWESEAHWANFWYQSGSSRRELLIESLMGRSNAEIRQIKESFSDKRYSDSLEKCMQTELKKDKFRNAVLLALEERKMDEISPLSLELVKRDVQDLHRALTSKEGGETAMINIVVVRSETHMREVLRVYEATYRQNFARDMIQKSRNLVGETLAHILNGVLNRPVRDALLIHQALAETSKDRNELLISRLVRFHWEPKHLERVKAEYKRKYTKRMEDDIEDKIGRDKIFGAFCRGLCEGGK